MFTRGWVVVIHVQGARRLLRGVAGPPLWSPLEGANANKTELLNTPPKYIGDRVVSAVVCTPKHAGCLFSEDRAPTRAAPLSDHEQHQGIDYDVESRIFYPARSTALAALRLCTT